MDPDFVARINCTIVWLNYGLRVYLDLYALDFPKKIFLKSLNDEAAQNKYSTKHCIQKFRTFFLINKVRVHGLFLVVQVSKREASPFSLRADL